MDLGGFGWAIQTVIGGFLLLGVIIWAMGRNKKKSSRADIARTEQATRDLYAAEDAEHRDEDRPKP